MLLSLLQDQQCSIYQLRNRFDSATGHTWNLNIGQVSTTLQRLERDGLAKRLAGEGNEADHFAITQSGSAELSTWWNSPVDRTRPERSELVMKIVAAAFTGSADTGRIIQIQRRHILQTMRDYTRLKRKAKDDLTWRLVLEHHIYMAEAELRWLDHVDTLLAGASASCGTALTRSLIPEPAHPLRPEMITQEQHS